MQWPAASLSRVAARHWRYARSSASRGSLKSAVLSREFGTGTYSQRAARVWSVFPSDQAKVDTCAYDTDTKLIRILLSWEFTVHTAPVTCVDGPHSAVSADQVD